MSSKYKFRNAENYYFITFSVVKWVDVFTRNIYRDILIDSFKYCMEHKGLRIHAYVIMSNHVHMIISSDGKNKLEGIMRDVKKYTSVQIINAINANKQESRRDWMLRMFFAAGAKNSNNVHFQFWQQDNHPIELTSNEFFKQKLNYIHENPVRCGYVSRPEDYLYSSARNYCDEEGVLDVIMLE